MVTAQELRKRFGARMRSLRKIKGLSQEQLATALKLNSDSISNIERGANGPGIETAYAIAGALGVSLSALYEIDPTTGHEVMTPAMAELISLARELDEKTLDRVVELVRAALKLNR